MFVPVIVMATKNSNSTQKDPKKRKGSFDVRYNDELEKLFYGIVKRIRDSADVHLSLERPLTPLSSNSRNTEKSTNNVVVGLTSDLCKLDLKSKHNERDKAIEKTVESIVVPTKQADIISGTVIKDLKIDLKKHRYSGVKFIIYGSYKNGLCTTHSDTIDLSCEYGENTPSSVKNLVLKFNEIFKTSSLFRVEELYEDARVPIIKLFHIALRKKVNVTFFNDLGIRNLSLTELYLSLNPNLKTLTLYLKELMYKYELCGKFKFTTHVLFWLVVFVLQEKALLPSVKDVRKAATVGHFVSGWNCSVPERLSFSVENQPAVSSLLFDFFVFYKDFNFLKYVMSPYHGRIFPIEEFERDLPIPEDAFDDENLRNVNSFYRRCLNMQDPVTLNYNLMVTIRIDTVNLFQLFCYRFATDVWKALPEVPKKMTGYGNHPPLDFDRYSSFDVFLRDIPTPWWEDINRYVRESVRKVMEIILEFQLDNFVEHDITQMVRVKADFFQKTLPVMYFDYCSTRKTWENEHFLNIISGGSKSSGEPVPQNVERDDKLVEVNLICDIDEENKKVYVHVCSNDRMTKFLHRHFGRLMLFVLHIIADPK